MLGIFPAFVGEEKGGLLKSSMLMNLKINLILFNFLCICGRHLCAMVCVFYTCECCIHICVPACVHACGGQVRMSNIFSFILPFPWDSISPRTIVLTFMLCCLPSNPFIHIGTDLVFWGIQLRTSWFQTNHCSCSSVLLGLVNPVLVGNSCKVGKFGFIF